MDKKSKLKISAIISIVVALVYLLIPVDVVPDAVPVVGWIDDAIAILVAVANTIRLVAKMR